MSCVPDVRQQALHQRPHMGRRIRTHSPAVVRRLGGIEDLYAGVGDGGGGQARGSSRSGRGRDLLQGMVLRHSVGEHGLQGTDRLAVLRKAEPQDHALLQKGPHGVRAQQRRPVGHGVAQEKKGTAVGPVQRGNLPRDA